MPHSTEPVISHLTAADLLHMQAALTLAEQAIGLSDPNPRVGCVIVSAAGEVLGQGHTQQAGGPHAEVMALRDAAAHGRTVAGATAYVTLEPCAHHGRTPPCCDALIAARLGRVVAACTDPNPLVAGQGLARLQAAGVTTVSGLLADPARELNIGFFSRMLRGRPWVRAKVAATLDGRTALDNGASQWITSADARRDGHAWRRRAGAVLTGVGTVLADDPRLDVRLVPSALQPLRVLLDSRVRTPATARLLAPPGHCLLCHCAEPSPAQHAELMARGVELLQLPADLNGRVDPAALLDELARRGINELHVEAGATLNGAWLAGSWVDEWLVYLAPKLVGGGRAMAAFGPLATLADAAELEFTSVQQIGPDLRVLARPHGRLGTWLKSGT